MIATECKSKKEVRFKMAKKYSNDKGDYFDPGESEASEIYKGHEILTYEELRPEKNEIEASEAAVEAGFNQVLRKLRKLGNKFQML